MNFLRNLIGWLLLNAKRIQKSSDDMLLDAYIRFG